jgi:hypothetical protein
LCSSALFIEIKLLIKKFLHMLPRYALIRKQHSHSTAGKLGIDSSVLFSLQVFWARIFILPKKVI